MSREAWRVVGATLAAHWAANPAALEAAGYAGPDDYRRRVGGEHGPTVARWIREGWRNA